ncbi:replication initiation factor domain-containing protein [Halopseudomonas aestusnigri]|uniref:replication initiation factor domain-containing protein n=1 Tax=Halopseudomonas aestusnigri TaxID=857252 RepID=UPI003002BC15
MTSSLTGRPAILCDWLDVTFSPTDCPYPELNLLLLDAGFTVQRDAGGSRCYVPPEGRGMVQVTHASRFAKVSISGGACAAIRRLGVFDQVLHVLGTSPHKVTRVDAALDVMTDASFVIESLSHRYPDGRVSLGRKALPVKRILSTRPDGRDSGTYYVGHRTAARFTARVYDKTLEALEKRGELLPPTTRFEVTARKDSGATLRDAALPESIFWHIAAPALLKLPEGVPVWQPNTDMTWASAPPTFDPAATLRRRVEHSAELDALADVADSLGDEGRKYLLFLLERRISPSAGSETADCTESAA